MLKKMCVILSLMVLAQGLFARSYPQPERAEYQVDEIGLGQYPMQFYPIGFADGRYFAYALYKDSADGVGAISYLKVVVQDLVTDKILDSWVYDEIPATEPLTFSALWQKGMVSISSLLNNYSIKPQSLLLQDLPLLYDGKSLDVFMKKTDAADQDNPFVKYQSVMVYAMRENGKKKVIRTLENPGFFEIRTGGVISIVGSPRAAVIMLIYSHSFEGSMDVDIMVVGCHLEKGFK